MKALKIIGGIIAVLLAIWVVLCLMGPTRYDGGASLEMDASASIIYNTISDLNTWSDWGPWMDQDPNIKSIIGEKSQGKGASYKWESEKMGNGSLEIMDAKPNKSMKTLVHFGDMGDSYGIWKIEEVGEKSKVSWGMLGDSDIPFIYRGFLVIQGNQTEFFEKGLNNIKTIVEKKAKETPKTYRGYTIKEMNMPAKNFIVHREKIAMADMEQFYTTHFPAIVGSVMKAGNEMDGMPHGLFYEWDEENKMTDMAAAVPVKDKTEVKGYETIEVLAGKTLVIDYYGAYAESGEAHYAMDEYIKEKKVEYSLVMEEYVTDPGSQPDTSKWLTKVFYKLK